MTRRPLSDGYLPPLLDEARRRQRAMATRLHALYDEVSVQPVPQDFLDILMGVPQARPLPSV